MTRKAGENNQDTRWDWVEALQFPAIIFDAGGAIAHANASAASRFGYERAEMVGGSVDFLIPEYVMPNAASLDDWLRADPSLGPPGLSLDLVAENADGTVEPVSVHIGPAGKSEPDFFLAAVDDAQRTADEAVTGESRVRALMADIGRIIGSSLELESVCEQFAVALVRALPAERVAICTITPGSDTYDLAYVSGGRSSRTAQLSPMPLAGSPIGAAMDARVPLLITSAELEAMSKHNPQLRREIRDGLKAVACVPLISSDEPVGGLLLSSSRDNAFTVADLDLLDQIARQIAGAIANMQLHADLKRESEEREILANIGRLTGSVLELADAVGIAQGHETAPSHHEYEQQ